MKLRKEQIEAFRVDRVERFNSETADFLQQRFPRARRRPLEELTPDVAAQTDIALGYGLVTDRQVRTYVTVSWLTKFELHHKPDVHAALSNARVSADAKTRWLERWIRRATRNAIRRRQTANSETQLPGSGEFV